MFLGGLESFTGLLALSDDRDANNLVCCILLCYALYIFWLQQVDHTG